MTSIVQKGKKDFCYAMAILETGAELLQMNR